MDKNLKEVIDYNLINYKQQEVFEPKTASILRDLLGIDLLFDTIKLGQDIPFSGVVNDTGQGRIFLPDLPVVF